MNWIKKLFKIEKKGDSTIIEDINTDSPIKKHEQLLINRVIELLQNDPDFFSARWFNGNSIDSSVQSRDRNILIMIKTGDILQPTRPIMTKEQNDIIKKLLVPIVERDSIYLIENLINK